MKTVVITGSTRGIGLGLAEAFLARDCDVVVSSRTAQAVEEAIAKLSDRGFSERIFGHPCDVTDPNQVQALWDAAQEYFGKVDIWINNAGVTGGQNTLKEIPPENVQAVININIMGTIYGARVAVRGMLDQGFGAIYNMEGLGSNGRKQAGLSLYGTSKYAVKYFTDALAKELDDSPITIGALQPGMVITDLVVEPYRARPDDLERVKRIFNIIADTVENVTPWLADKILTNQKNGARFRYTSTPKLLGRFILSPFTKRDLFAELDLE